MKLTIYRYDPDKDAKPYYQDYDVAVDSHDRMLLDALVKAKAQDDSLAFVDDLDLRTFFYAVFLPDFRGNDDLAFDCSITFHKGYLW